MSTLSLPRATSIISNVEFMILSLFCSLDKCKISLLKIFHPKFLTNFDLIILFVFKISLLISYQYNMRTEHTNNCNMKFLKSFFSNNHGLSLLLFFGYKSIGTMLPWQWKCIYIYICVCAFVHFVELYYYFTFEVILTLLL
jgi:hypothetical protein